MNLKYVLHDHIFLINRSGWGDDDDIDCSICLGGMPYWELYDSHPYVFVFPCRLQVETKEYDAATLKNLELG